MENRLSVGSVTMLCAIPCAVIMVFAAYPALACGLLVCWLLCSLFIWIGEAAGKVLSKKSGKKDGIIGTWIICALLLIIVIVEVCRDLSLPKPPKDSIINLWGLGSFLISLIVLPPVFSAVILNSAALIMQKSPAKSNTILHGKRAVGLAAKLILGLTGYAVALLLLMFL